MKRLLILLAILSLGSCGQEKTERPLQGYVEGYKLILAPRTLGVLVRLNVAEGDQVQAGKILFVVDSRRARAQLAEAVAARAAAQSRLKNLTKGGRPQEIRAATETLKVTRAALTLARQSYVRSKNLVDKGVSAIARLDRDRAALDSARARVTEAGARLNLIALPARSDVIAAARHDVVVRSAAVRRARVVVQERTVIAPASGLIEVLYRRVGEVAGPTLPVLALLPPAQKRIRFFVPEPMLAKVHLGGRITIQCDNCQAGMQGKIVFVSDQAEFTPPIIFSEKERAKLVYMIEARPDHPEKFLTGQPVSVMLQ